MRRDVEGCEFRADVRRRRGREEASCRIAGASVPRASCEQCCLSGPPGPDPLNEVTASLVYRSAARSRDPVAAAALKERAEGALKVLWRTPNGPDWTGPVPNLRAMAEIIDPSVNADTLAGHLRRLEPFAYLRYGDGEWLSILGAAGRNGDGHDLLPETLGLELRETLAYAARLGPAGGRFYVGLHAIRFQDAIRRYLVEHGIAYRLRVVGDNLFAHGYFDLSTRRFLEAVKGFAGPKFLVGNPSHAPVAEGLGCRHVVIPRTDCYLEIERAERESRFSGRGLLLSCASAMSECLFRRLHEENPGGTFVDCGHIFDAFVGNLSRDYTQANGSGILDFLREHYAPLVLGRPALLGDPP